jgi:COP9 signalosome complex subunit 1
MLLSIQLAIKCKHTYLDLFAQTRHYADYIIASHVHDLTNLIRDRALVLYFQPFASIRLERMSQAFGFSIPEIEKAVVGLIQSGQIKARLDSQNKVCMDCHEIQPQANHFVIDSQSAGGRSSRRALPTCNEDGC